MAEQQPETTDLNNTFQVSENEDAAITRSLQESLLVQAPLQVILETLYDKLKAQSGAISKINKEVAELRGDEGNPLDRLRLLEQRFNAIFGEPGSEAMFSPFKQQELMNKVEYLGNTVAQQAEVIRHLQTVKTENTYPRLERLEAALHGVDNLAGRTVAMDTMAADLAVPIPTLNTTPISPGPDGSAAFRTSLISTPATLTTFPTPAAPGTSETARESVASPASPRAAASASSAASPRGSATASSPASPRAAVRASPAASPRASASASSALPAAQTAARTSDTATFTTPQAASQSVAMVATASEPDSTAQEALLNSVASYVNASQSPVVAVAADETRKSLATGQQPRTIKALHDGIRALWDDNQGLRMRIGDMAIEQDELTTEHKAQMADSTARIDALEEAHETTSKDVGQRLLHLDMCIQVVNEVDVRGMHDRLHALVRQFDETDIFVKHLQNKELPAVRDDLHEMRQFVKMAASAANGELRDALLALERDLEVVKKKLNGGLLACLGADKPSITGMARQSDLQEVSNSVGTKVDRTELQGILKKAVTGALDAAQKELAVAAAAAINNAAARAVKARCLSCDREVQPRRPESVGPLPSKAGLLPNTDKFPRPATAGAGGLAGFPAGPGLNAAAARQLAMEERRGNGSCSAQHSGGDSRTERRRPATASPTPPVFL